MGERETYRATQQRPWVEAQKMKGTLFILPIAATQEAFKLCLRAV
jgi:hypothetical protein